MINRMSSPFRVALYLRFSAEMQRSASIVDQERECRAFAKKNGWEVVAKYSDEAVRAGALAGRDGWSRLLGAAKRREFDLVLVEELSRFSRDFMASWDVLAELMRAEVQLADTKRGLVRIDSFEDQVITALSFAQSQAETKRLGERSKRGLRGQVEKGFSSGGRPAYGYERKVIFSIKEVDVDGRQKRIGARWIPEATQHPIVVRIFGMYVDGWSKTGIARQLNKEGIPTRDAGRMRLGQPNAGTWTATSIKSILENEIYIGMRIWNRNSRTGELLLTSGKKGLRKNPDDELVTINDYCEPIISQELWRGSQRRLKEDAKVYAKKKTAKVNQKYLLSGFIRCASCGYNYSIGSRMRKEHVHYRCGYRASRGANLCDNKTVLAQPAIEKRVRRLMDTIVKDPATLRALVAEHNREIQDINVAQLSAVRSLEGRKNDLLLQQTNVVEAVSLGAGMVAVLVKRLKELEEQLAEVDTRIAEARELIQPIMVPSIVTEDDFVSGSASVFSGDHHKDRAFLEQTISRILVYADGSVVVRFRANNLFTPVEAYRLGRESHEPLAEARHRQLVNYEGTRLGLEDEGRMPVGAQLVVVEAPSNGEYNPYYIFTEPGSWLEAPDDEPGPPEGGGSIKGNGPGVPPKEEPRFQTVCDPNGIRTRVAGVKGQCPRPTRRWGQVSKLINDKWSNR